jgi:hypothetical protein
MASLRELQYSFAAALRDPAASCPVSPAANLDVYRNNGESQFRGVLETSFPVLRRRVGDDYFRQLAHHYRQAHPSRSGDLLWIGREFAGFLVDHLRGSEYEWLADLARLEWLRELSLIAEARPPLGPEILARYPAEELERLVFMLQPSLHLLASPFPVFSIWQANQRENAPPVDQSVGYEQGMVLCRDNATDVRALPASLFAYLLALAEGRSLGEAVSVAGLDEAGLLYALQFLFVESLVCGVSPPPP